MNEIRKLIEEINKSIVESENDGLVLITPLDWIKDWAEESLKKIDDKEKKIEELRLDLLEFGRHDEGCNYIYSKNYGCKCGWLKVKEIWQTEEEKK
jgi:hypothetical protein